MTGFPSVTAAQMAEVDRIMAARFGVEPVQLMEVAGHAVATFARAGLMAGDVRGQRVVAVAGSGGNGGDALVAARYLAAWGAAVTVVLSRPATQLTGLPAAHVRSIQALGLAVQDGSQLEELPPAGIVIDGLLGFGATGSPSGTVAHLVELINRQPGAVLAIDVPSGIDATAGTVEGACVLATTTLTLGLPKTGLMTEPARDVTGRLVVADIGIPAAAYAGIGVTVPGDLFATTSFLEVRSAAEPSGGSA